LNHTSAAAVEGQSATSTLARVRYRVLGELKRVPTSPFAYQSSPAKLDYEEKAIALLERGLTTRVGTTSRSEAERTAYLGALTTYGDTVGGKASLARVRSALEAELAVAPDALSRESLRNLLKLF
jgi:hypothetical protein